MNDESSRKRETTTHSPNATSTGDGKSVPQFGAPDLWPFADALGRHWKWLLFGGGIFALIAFSGGMLLWKNSYTASAQLVREAPTRVTEVLGDRELDPNTYASLLRSPELVQRVASQATPPLSVEKLTKKLNITAERNSDVLMVAVSLGDRQDAVNLANLYSREAVGFMQEMQTNAAARARIFLTRQLAP